jgi:hypothetical protein
MPIQHMRVVGWSTTSQAVARGAVQRTHSKAARYAPCAISRLARQDLHHPASQLVITRVIS